MITLVDSNVLLDVLADDPDCAERSGAAVEGLTLLTRDARRFRTYLPRLRISTP